MKEFVEKLIGRLEEKQKIETSFKRDNFSAGVLHGYRDAISTINQLAEEYNNDVCEWIKYEDKRANYNNCKWRNEDIDEFSVNHFRFCPYCGRKIKVVE